MNRIYLYILLCVVCVSACTTPGLEKMEKAEVQGIEFITAEIVQPAGLSSRLVIGDQLLDGSYPVKWRADNPDTKPNEADVIYVYDSKGHAARFVYNEPEGDKRGIFIRDKEHGSPIENIKNALCVPTAVGRANDLPEAVDKKFNFMPTMMYTRGAENAPMYGVMKDGVLKFQIVTGMVQLNIPNIQDFRPTAEDAMAVRIKAFTQKGEEQYITATSAHLDFKDPGNPVVSLDGGQAGHIALFMQSGIAMGSTCYFPLVTGEYGSLEIELWTNGQFSDESRRLSKTVVVTPAPGQATFTIEKKIYSITTTFEKK